MHASFVRAAPELAARVPGAVRAAIVVAVAAGETVLASDDNEEADVAVGASSTTDVVHVNLVVTRKTRVPITIGVKKTICRMPTKGMSWSSIIAELPVDVSRDAVRKIYRLKDTCTALPDDAMTAMRTTRREGNFPAVDKLLLEWITAVERLGHATVPVSFALLQEKAAEIGRRLGLATFRASRGYVRGFLSRNELASMRLHGQAGAVDTIAIERDLEKFQEELAAFKDDDNFNMDETGLFYRCLPSKSYVSNGARRTARGVKAMKAKDRVTVVLCCNASGMEKLPAALIGSSKVPTCFKGPDRTPPLPYMDQSNAWMDGTRFKKWFDEVFVPGVITHDRRKVAMMMDNASSHGFQVGHPQVQFFFLPSSSTARNQPLDAGIVAAVKRGYRRRPLKRVVDGLGELVKSPSAERRQLDMATSPSPPPDDAEGAEVEGSAAEAAPAPSAHTAAAANPEADCTGPSFVTPRSEYSALLEREAANALPASRRGRSANWGLGVGAGNAANLIDEAVMVKEEWAAITRECIVHCWAKAEVLGTIRTHDFLKEHGEYRRSFRAVADDMDEVLSMLRGTTLGEVTLGGLSTGVQRTVVEEWLDVEEQPAGMISEADGCLEEASTTLPPLIDDDED